MYTKPVGRTQSTDVFPQTNMGPYVKGENEDVKPAEGGNYTATHSIPELIIKKRNGIKLTADEIECFIQHLVSGKVQDGQLGAMLMAMFLKNLDLDETTNLTKAMTHSGDVLSWPDEWKGLMVDKHSTGGVGDKVSLVLAPALAACGMKVPMVSGRGLGHTGGTLDKLESIPGFKVSLSNNEMITLLKDVGCFIAGQTSNLVPADKIMYAARDVTGTTDHIALITSSIISKKVAETLDSLVLDVKVGKGAMLKDETAARELANRMVTAGNGSGVKTVALLTDMNSPLGNMIGNSLEVAESITCLNGDGPQDIVDLVVKLGGHLLYKAGQTDSLQDGFNKINETLQNGSALNKFSDMLKGQGVDTNVADSLCTKEADVFAILPKAKYNTDIKSQCAGFVHSIDAMKCALVTCKLGAGRSKAGESVNFGVGLQIVAHVGQAVEEGSTWITVHHDQEELSPEFKSQLAEALVVKQQQLTGDQTASRVLDVIS